MIDEENNNKNEVNIIVGEENKEENINLLSPNNEVNLSKIGSKNKNLDVKQNITNIKKLEKEYFIGNVIGDFNCLFYFLSNLTFGKINFY